MSGKYSFWQFMRDHAEGIFGLIVILACLSYGVFGGIGPCARKAKAECITHTVKQGETLRKISREYYGNVHHWKDIKWHNNLRSTVLSPNQKLQIYVPDYVDWSIACSDILYQRLEQLRLVRSTYFVREFIAGIEGAALTAQIDSTPTDLLEACRWAITTAEQESMYKFAVGGAGEIGMFQFKLDTVRLTYRWYQLDRPISDLMIVSDLMNIHYSVEIFVLHFRKLYKRCGSLWLAWKRYNNGSEAAAYASKALKRYHKIRRLQPLVCKQSPEKRKQE